jgi:hypothetical protein
LNDFTKEELFIIHDLIHDCLIGYDHKIKEEQLWDKVQNMIANYCEHEFVIRNTCSECNQLISAKDIPKWE